jgi:hypothetical protein
MKTFDDLRSEAVLLKASVPLPQLVAETLPIKRNGRVWNACCPFHGEKTPSFTVFDDHYHCFGCGARGDVIDWTMRTRRLTFGEAVEYLSGGTRSPSTAEKLVSRPGVPAAGDSESTRWARRIWMESVDARNTLAERYLQSRGLKLPSGIAAPDGSVIRFHPALWHKPSQQKLPAMVSLMTDVITGHPTGVHRTFLDPNGLGKAPVPRGSQKMMLGRQGVIKLYRWMGDGLGVTEGIETGLSVAQHFEWVPIWAAGSSTMLGNLPILPAAALTIFADNDANNVGAQAADACAQRWVNAGAEVWIRMPPPGDWDDVKEAWRE